MAQEKNDNLYIADLPSEVDENMIRSIFGAYGTVLSCRAMPGRVPGQKGAALVRFASADEAEWLVQNLSGNIAEGLMEPVKVRFANKSGSGGKGGSGGGGGGSIGGGAFGGVGSAATGDWGSYGKASEWGGYGSMQAPASAPYGGKGGSKGKGKQVSVSSADIRQVIAGLAQLLPGGGRKPDENCLYLQGLPSNTTDGDLYRLFAPFGAIPSKGVLAKLLDDGSCSGVGFVDFVDVAAAQAAQVALNGMVLPDGVVLTVQQKRKKGHSKGAGALH